MNHWLILVFLIGSTYTSNAQFLLNGNAAQTNDTCYRLTQASVFQSGSIWNPNKIDLNQSFDLVLQVFLGCEDTWGADGMVFGFQPVSTSLGTAGGGLGFLGIAPSLGVEMDTWQNDDVFDPAYDHLAIIKNGVLNHQSSSTLAGPIQASPNNPNIEDCNFHDLRISWEAPIHKLTVYFDCQIRLVLTNDIVQNIFNGDPFVFWGFTAATGGAMNVQQVCFSYTSFLDQMEDIVMCPGGQVQLSARGGIQYKWTPEEGLNNPNIANPIAAPTQTTVYTVNILDACNRPFYDEVTVAIAGDAVFFDLGADTTLCEGNSLQLDATTPTAVYQWMDGSQNPTLTVSSPGLYAVTVTRTDTFCIASDWIDIGYRQVPTVDLGADTTLCRGQMLLLDASFPEASYRWQDGTSTPTYAAKAPGVYEVNLLHPCGESTDQVAVDFENCRKVFIPNAFSPNQDGINDELRCFQDGDVEIIHVFRVFDRWGGLLWESKEVLPDASEAAWNGQWRGKAAPAGTYVYLIELTFRDGHRTRLSGDVAILR